MTKHHLDQSLEEHELPDLDIFWLDEQECNDRNDQSESPDTDFFYTPAWYWLPYLKCCMPRCEPIGPFDTEKEALNDARFDGPRHGAPQSE